MAKAADRKAARAREITALRRPESFKGSDLALCLSILVRKTNNRLPCRVRTLTTAKSRPKWLGHPGAGLLPARQTRYECALLSGQHAYGGSPWHPKRNSGGRSPPWSRRSRTAP